MDVQTRAIQTGVASPHRVLTNQLADLADQLIVEGGGDDAVARIAGALDILLRVIGLNSIAVLTDGVLLGHAGRSVVVNGQRLADRVDVDGHAQTVRAELRHPLVRQLILEDIPLRFVVVVFHHVDEL